VQLSANDRHITVDPRPRTQCDASADRHHITLDLPIHTHGATDRNDISLDDFTLVDDDVATDSDLIAASAFAA
jgi:hypothetical protein